MARSKKRGQNRLFREAVIEPTGGGGPLLRLDHISKLFGSFRAVDDLSLDIEAGEVFALLGPSGCGKSTTLRQIAGLDQPDSGTIALKGNVLFSADDDIFLPPQKRNMGMVFQSYAIWPHLSVAETVAYPLRLRKVPRAEVDVAVTDILRQVGLDGMGDRPSTTLSGGQQQRVALARALVYKPDMLLLDEPFSNLDVKLREQMRVELKLLQRQVGVTVILVTHDQTEALSLADRVAVMNAGKIEQVGDPVTLYEKPSTPFVREFIGLSTCFDASVISMRGDGSAEVLLEGMEVPLFSTAFHNCRPANGVHLLASIRPEAVAVGASVVPDQGNVLEGKVETLLFAGDRFECHMRVGAVPLMAYSPRSERLREGDILPLQIPKDALSLWPK
jgi:ABC-type Fe3+/spermidine/putrescine transport system ATPase subunit